MFRRHRADPTQDDDDDDDEEDAFSALARRHPDKKIKTSQDTPPDIQPAATVKNNTAETTVPSTDVKLASNESVKTTSEIPLVASTTSSMKRHHKEGRKAKMDAMLHELHLQAVEKTSNKRPPRSTNNSSANNREPRGSHVEPGQEHLTTNIFVGNLAPHITEEELTNLFGQFGDLYSVKIMWPRTAEERARQRLTGFVCFHHRNHAEDAMTACSEADPFNVGRTLMLRWGKNVLKNNNPSRSTSPPPSPRRTSVSPPMSRPQQQQQDMTHHEGLPRIQVQLPKDPTRVRFINQVASFVAKDGADLEQRLLEEQRADMAFLNPGGDANNAEEHVYYKWRVFAFTQGDSEYLWRTDPFVMVGACLWIPPPIADPQAAARFEEERRQEEERQRRMRPVVRRSTKRPRHHSSSSQKQRSLSREELEIFDSLARHQLCASREAIAQAMAFCFDKAPHSSHEIANLLRELLLQRNGVSVDTRIARLYLLSDVLFNAQQPGVRNAFYYRDAIEQMAPGIFTSLGDSTGADGRMTHHKMRRAVSAVLSAWTNWSVYIPSFLDELEARFEGRPIPTAKVEEIKEEPAAQEKREESDIDDPNTQDEDDEAKESVPRGDWKEVDEDDENSDEGGRPLEEEDDADGEPVVDNSNGNHNYGSEVKVRKLHAPNEGDSLSHARIHATERKAQEEEADGEPLDDPDGMPLDDPDGEQLDDPDGEAQGEGADGEPLDDPDGEQLDDADGEPIDDPERGCRW